MGQILSLPLRLLGHTKTFYSGFWYYWWGNGRSLPFKCGKESPLVALQYNEGDDNTEEDVLFKQHAQIHLYRLAADFFLYDQPHYRKGSYREDLVDNLRNVAVPGTGVPLSLFAFSKTTALGYLMFAYPSISMVAAVHQWLRTRGKTSISEEYGRRLLAPDDWFSYWRMNCTVVGLHALLHDTPKDYDMENKWTFLKEGKKRGVPVSPFLETPAIVVKHRNEEGGLGIFFYKNAVDGGDWIIQERIENSSWVNSLLPENAPLSTFRVITCSRMGLSGSHSKDKQVSALSCVFRAGREGASTDHDSVLFDVDVTTGTIRAGTTNAHWYKLGFLPILTCPWRSDESYPNHPDGNIPVQGSQVPDIKGMLRLVEDSHQKMCPVVPLAGWDVVLSADLRTPICLLEVNLSCNFFGAQINRAEYLNFLQDTVVDLQKQRMASFSNNK